MSQFISLQTAVNMTTLYRTEMENVLAPTYKGQNILCRCETFDRSVVDSLLVKPDCAFLRIYYGMDPSLKIHAILVPVNKEGEDILPEGLALGEGEDIAEQALRCPHDCPPISPLNP